MKAITVYANGVKTEGIRANEARLLRAAVFPSAQNEYGYLVRVAVYKLPPGPAIGPEVTEEEEASALILWLIDAEVAIVNDLTTADVLAIIASGGETTILAVKGQYDRIAAADGVGTTYVLDNNLDVWRVPSKHVNALLYRWPEAF